MVIAYSRNAKLLMRPRTQDEATLLACPALWQQLKRLGVDQPFLAASAMKSSTSRLHLP